VQTLARSIGDRLVIAIFLASILAPSVDWWFSIDKTPELNENRSLAGPPAWPSDRASISAFPKALDAYWNDHFGFRRLLVSRNALLGYELGVSTSSQVIVGRHNFLFLTGDSDADAARADVPYTDAELSQWAAELDARRSWLARRGAKFLFVIAPDKQSIYPEMLPDRSKAGRERPVGQLVRYLAQHSQADVLDLRPLLVGAKAQGQTYWRTDTHWSNEGERVGYDAILARLASWFPQLAARPDSTFKPVTRPRWAGDLAVLLGIKELLPEPYAELDPRPYTSHAVAPDGYRPASSRLYVVMEGASGKAPRAVFFHDSFFVSPQQRYPDRSDELLPRDTALDMIALLAEPFSRSVFTWQRTFDSELVEREHPDIVVEECVERQLRSGPDGAAPVR
jgi:hypothetical protein